MLLNNFRKVNSAFQSGVDSALIPDRKSVLIEDGYFLGYPGMKVLLYPKAMLSEVAVGSTAIAYGFIVEETIRKNIFAKDGFILATCAA